MIQFDHVSIVRGNARLLSEVCFRIEPGQKVAISGPSGCGKTSLLMALLGAFPIPEGRILFEDRPVTPDSIHRVRQAVAFIGQEPVLGAETVREALLLPFSFKANRHARPAGGRIEEALATVGLPSDIVDKRCSVVSGGEKQRIAVARALLLGKRTFLADEVTSALDAVSKEAVMDLLTQPDFTVLTVTHDPDWLGRCPHRLRIADGRLTAQAATPATGGV